MGLKRFRAELHAGMFSTLLLTRGKGVSSKTENTVYPNCGILYAGVRQMGCFINPINNFLFIKSRFGCYKRVRKMLNTSLIKVDQTREGRGGGGRGEWGF